MLLCRDELVNIKNAEDKFRGAFESPAENVIFSLLKCAWQRLQQVWKKHISFVLCLFAPQFSTLFLLIVHLVVSMWPNTNSQNNRI